jgi:hypothetical protein
VRQPFERRFVAGHVHQRAEQVQREVRVAAQDARPVPGVDAERKVRFLVGDAGGL